MVWPPEESRGISPAQRKALAEAMRIERQLALEAGLLIPTAEVRRIMVPLITALGRFLDALPSQMGRQFNLPDQVVREMRRAIDDRRRQFVASAPSFCGEATDESGS